MSIDKAAMRKAGERIDFMMVGHGLDERVMIEPRTGDRWRVTIFNTTAMGESLCHVDDLRTDITDPIELVRLALNAYRDHRGPVAV